MKRPQLSQPIAGAANPEFFFRQGFSGAKTGSYELNSAQSRAFLIDGRFIPIDLSLRRRRYLNKKRPQLRGTERWGRHSSAPCGGRGAAINVSGQCPFLEGGCVTEW